MSAFHVYILFSTNINQYYKVQTDDLVDRLKRHNSGYEIGRLNLCQSKT